MMLGMEKDAGDTPRALANQKPGQDKPIPPPIIFDETPEWVEALLRLLKR